MVIFLILSVWVQVLQEADTKAVLTFKDTLEDIPVKHKGEETEDRVSSECSSV